MMIIGLLVLELHIPASGSLKDKRQVIRSLVTRIRQTYNVSVSEVDHQDSWQRCTLAAACVSGERASAQRALQQVSDFVEDNASEYVVLEVSTELM